MLACGITFSNPAPITIPASGTMGAATPYPSNITVSGVAGTIADVNVTINGFSHTFPADVDMLLVGPGGQNAKIWSDVGSGSSVVGLNITLDDAAAAPLPTTPLVSGTFRPTNIGISDGFPAPAPRWSGQTALSTFNGTDPNGTWNLYVVDDASVDVGSIAGGWSLDITTGAEEIADLRDLVASFGIHHGIANALDSKLRAALAALDVGDTAGACDSLQAFLNQVSAQSGKKLTEGQAQQLTEAANDIQTLLDC